LDPLTIDLGPANQGGGYGDPVSAYSKSGTNHCLAV
jgi:hypothetical protein